MCPIYLQACDLYLCLSFLICEMLTDHPASFRQDMPFSCDLYIFGFMTYIFRASVFSLVKWVKTPWRGVGNTG